LHGGHAGQVTLDARLTSSYIVPAAYNGRVDRVYLDICSLKRPFDDQRQSRVREEAMAVAAIIGRAEAGEIALVRSPAHLVENDANPREDRRLAAALWIDGAGVDVGLDANVEARAHELVALAFSPLDALHLAFAERAGARWFVTCDDKLLKLAARLGHELRILVVPPPALLWRNTP
jgi:predicted nucleic acid-binding protein